jgi:hypothetical protein
VPYNFRTYGRALVELFDPDNDEAIVLSPRREELRPAELQWLEKFALPDLRREIRNGEKPRGPSVLRREREATRGGFRFWREHGRVYAEMLMGGGTIVVPERRLLTADERRWVDEGAQAEFTVEWRRFATWQCSERTRRRAEGRTAG